MLSEIEVVTGLVAGVAVAPERRKNMMKVSRPPENCQPLLQRSR